MRVAIIVKSLTLGGMERAAINLAETFAQEGHESHLIYFKEKGRALTPNDSVKLHLFELEKILKRSGIGLIFNLIAKILNGIIRYSYFYWQGMLLTPIFKWKLHTLEKEHGKFDLILIRGQGTFEMIWPYKEDNVVIQQVNLINQKKRPFKDFFTRVLFSNKQVMCNAQGVYDSMQSDFKKSGVIPKSFTVIASPVNIERIKKRSFEYEPEVKEKYIVNIGRLSLVKNVTLLIDAYAYAREHYELQEKLVIVGDGSLKQELQAQAESLHVSKFIHFTGALTNPYPWLKNAQLFVFTSLHEGLPNVLLESLVCETNIVSTRGGGGTMDIMSGVLAKNLVDFDKVDLAKMIMSVLSNPQAIDFDTYLEPYKAESVVKEYLKIYC